MLCVSWSDKLADYRVYVPTCDKDKKLNNKRCLPMVPHSMKAAA